MMPKALTTKAVTASLSPDDQRRFTALAEKRGLTVESAMSEAAFMWMESQVENQFFDAIKSRVSWPAFDRLLSDRTRGEAPRPGDELPQSYKQQNA